MKNVSLDALKTYLTDVFLKCGLSNENAAAATDVIYRATLRGVGHHDIYDFAPRAEGLISGAFKANPDYKKISSFGAMESWDADNGLGEVVCTFAMDRAMALADQFGMGFCALRNTNHYLAAAPYVERASEMGYIGLLLCKGGVSMGAPGRAGNCMSALPMGFAYATNDDYPVMLDACMAYASFGLLQEMAEKGKKTPEWWGLDKEGNPTTDPMAMASGTRFPIGGHKGFGLCMLGEVLTSVMSQGCILNEKETSDGLTNWSAHTAIAIKADALMDADTFKHRAGELSRRASELSPGLHIPGMGSHNAKTSYVEKKAIELEDSLIEKLNEIAAKLSVKVL